MKRFRNLFLVTSVLLSLLGFVLIVPFSPAAATGFGLGCASNILVMLGRIQALVLAKKSGTGIKFGLYCWGFIGWAAYAAAFYVVYRVFDNARGAGIMGVAGGLVLPLAVVAALGATDAGLEETAD